MRKLETGEGLVVLPESLVERVERYLDASDTKIFVVYKDEHDGEEIAAMIRESLKGL